MQRNCNREGFNEFCKGGRNVGDVYSRLGIFFNEQNDCNSCDTMIGLGMSVPPYSGGRDFGTQLKLDYMVWVRAAPSAPKVWESVGDLDLYSDTGPMFPVIQGNDFAWRFKQPSNEPCTDMCAALYGGQAKDYRCGMHSPSREASMLFTSLTFFETTAPKCAAEGGMDWDGVPYSSRRYLVDHDDARKPDLLTMMMHANLMMHVMVGNSWRP